ncbi:hypothetical protein HGA34_05510 [Candidatus Falkowbacteria bacterium]|nr:hypothetical protein [Candidatus Falkowbacteria bacterium]
MLKNFRKTFFLLMLVAVAIPFGASAHVPFLEGNAANQQELSALRLESAEMIPDPNQQSLAVYGKLKHPGEVDAYRFQPTISGVVSLELLVPAWPGMDNFFPELLVVGSGVGDRIGRPLPTSLMLPSGLTGFVLNNQLLRPRHIMLEPYSLERLYNGEKIELEVSAGTTYYLVVTEPSRRIGVYSLAVGDKENFQSQPLFGVFINVLKMKLGLLDGVSVPWLDLVSEFLVMLGLALLFFAGRHLYLNGFTISDPSGLESIFLQTRSKSLRGFGLGLGCWFVGQGWFNRLGWFSQTGFFQLTFFILLVLLFLLLVRKFKADWWLVKQHGTELSEVRRPRRFRFGYRLYQTVWSILLALAVWQNFINK